MCLDTLFERTENIEMFQMLSLMPNRKFQLHHNFPLQHQSLSWFVIFHGLS